LIFATTSQWDANTGVAGSASFSLVDGKVGGAVSSSSGGTTFSESCEPVADDGVIPKTIQKYFHF
jgi:hypothetical protein